MYDSARFVPLIKFRENNNMYTAESVVVWSYILRFWYWGGGILTSLPTIQGI